ncbi:MAG: A24 family peptidase [Phenylobacterium sp.]
MMHLLQTLPLLVFSALVITGALRDLVTYTIPNWLSVALVAGFPIAALAMGLPLPTISLHFAIGVAALIAGMAMFALRWIGGGDAKLFAAAALWLGWPALMTYLAVTGLAGGALAVGLLGLRSPLLRGYVLSGPAWFVRLAEPDENVPYGVAIAVGALVAFPASTLMQAIGLPI